MQSIINEITNFVVVNLQNFGPFFGVLIILLESIIPVLPLGVFIALNMMAFGNVVGFVISWLSTCIGCLMSYLLFRFLGSKLEKFVLKNKRLIKLTETIKKMTLSNLVLVIALPFTPAFLINISCGLSKMNLKKFLIGILVGKVAIVYFWGFVSKSLIQSITDINSLITIGFLLLISFVISKVIKTKFNIE